MNITINKREMTLYEQQLHKTIESHFRTKSDSYMKECIRVWQRWYLYCANNGLHQFELSPENVKSFISQISGKASNQESHLIRLRKLLVLLYSATNGQIPILNHWFSLLNNFYTVREIIGVVDREVYRRFLTEDELRMIFDFAGNDTSDYGHRNTVILALLFLCGLRVNEMRLLTWNEIDFDRRKIYPIHAKKGNKQSVEVPVKALEYLTVYKDYVFNQLEFLPDNLILPTTTGRKFSMEMIRVKPCINSRTVNDVLRKIAQQLEIEHFSSHAGRRTLATLLYHADRNVVNIQRTLRHKENKTTINCYIQPLENEEQQNNAIDNLFN